jgi:hypothetical protein
LNRIFVLRLAVFYLFVKGSFFHFQYVSITKIGFVFIEQFYKKNISSAPETCHVFLLSWLLANKGTISCINNVRAWICSVHHPLLLNPKVNIHKPGTNSVLLGTTLHFYLLIKFQFKFHRNDQQQRSSVIDNKMLNSRRSLINFQIQSHGYKLEVRQFENTEKLIQWCRITKMIFE